MLENLFDHRGFLDGGDDADPPLAAGTGPGVDTENSLQKARPVDALFAGWALLAFFSITVFKRQLLDGLGFGSDVPAVFLVRS